jgi:hypothetical protein
MGALLIGGGAKKLHGILKQPPGNPLKR